jgi:hypothetical protein
MARPRVDYCCPLRYGGWGRLREEGKGGEEGSEEEKEPKASTSFPPLQMTADTKEDEAPVLLSPCPAFYTSDTGYASRADRCHHNQQKRGQ